jgi:hypothetical protein
MPDKSRLERFLVFVVNLPQIRYHTASTCPKSGLTEVPDLMAQGEEFGIEQ